MITKQHLIPDFDGKYYITELGQVVNVKTGKLLNSFARAGGFHNVKLTAQDSAQKSRSIHLLVLAAFHGDKPPGAVARHRDGNRSNNSATNLYWAVSSKDMLGRTQWDNEEYYRYPAFTDRRFDYDQIKYVEVLGTSGIYSVNNNGEIFKDHGQPLGENTSKVSVRINGQKIYAMLPDAIEAVGQPATWRARALADIVYSAFMVAPRIANGVVITLDGNPANCCLLNLLEVERHTALELHSARRSGRDPSRIIPYAYTLRGPGEPDLDGLPDTERPPLPPLPALDPIMFQIHPELGAMHRENNRQWLNFNEN